MYSRRALGTVALIALAIAAISFAVVDVTTSISRSCDVTEQCSYAAVPIVAISAAALGFLSLGVGLIPAIMWIVSSVRSARQRGDETDEQVAIEHREALFGVQDGASNDTASGIEISDDPRPVES